MTNDQNVQTVDKPALVDITQLPVAETTSPTVIVQDAPEPKPAERPEPR